MRTRHHIARRRGGDLWLRHVLGGALVVVPSLVLGGCNRDNRSEPDTALAAAGDTAPALREVSGSAGGSVSGTALRYEVSDERYQQWVAAQRALDALPGLAAPPPLDARRASDAEIDRAVAFLEGDARARRAIEDAGLSVRDYVLTTVALDQALVVASGRTQTRRREDVPQQTMDVVTRNRADLEREWRDMRYRIAAANPDSLGARAADSVVSAATVAARRADSLAPTTPGNVREAGTPGGDRTGLIPAGSTMALRSDQRICTNTNKVGDRFTATLTSGVPGTNNAVIPAGAKATLKITRLQRSKTATDPIVVGFDVSSIAFGGTTYPVEAAVTGANVNRVRSPQTSQDASKGAAGAINGAIAGQVLGQDTRSTVIGAATGAATGAGAAAATGSYDGCVPEGGEIRITLEDEVRVRT